MKYYARIRKTFKRGEVIFSENSECDGMYIIDSGKVRVYKTLGNGDQRKEVDLCTLGTKAMFGEMAMIDEKRRSASVMAVEPTVCTVITKKIFEDQLTHIPTWMVNMIRILVSRLRETNDRLRKIVEDYTSTPVDDTGSIITVDAETAARAGSLTPDSGPGQNGDTVADGAAGDTRTEGSNPKGGLCQSDEIVQSLFKR